MNGTEEHVIPLLAELDAPTEDLRSLMPPDEERIATLDRLLARGRSCPPSPSSRP